MNKLSFYRSQQRDGTKITICLNRIESITENGNYTRVKMASGAEYQLQIGYEEMVSTIESEVE